MSQNIHIKTAFISVYHKEGLAPIVEQLNKLGILCYSTGGTARYLSDLGARVEEVADLTGYPSILGGRVKTLHPKVHGGILARRHEPSDQQEVEQHEIPLMDLVIVDLYPFEATVASGAKEAEVIEKIDIGGIALIRAAAKNFQHVAIVPSQAHYADFAQLLKEQGGEVSLDQRKKLAAEAFDVSSHYDTHIHRYLHKGPSTSLKVSLHDPEVLRYGENPHQQGLFYGKLSESFEQLHGKALSYNNLVDIDGALQLIDEFEEEPTFVVIKHTNACGCAAGSDLLEAWKRALAGDPISAFGGILACNRPVDEAVAREIQQLFFEVLIAPDVRPEALKVLQQRKRAVLLKRQPGAQPASMSVRSLLNGYLVQQRDEQATRLEDISYQSSRTPSEQEVQDALFAEKVCKHLKSNAIALVKNQQLIGSGTGQTSRIDAVRHAIHKAQQMGFDLKGAVLASDAFFPFADSVKYAHEHGIEVVIQPGGSKRDQETIDFCENHDMCLIFTGVRHFKH